MRRQLCVVMVAAMEAVNLGVAQVTQVAADFVSQGKFMRLRQVN